MYVYRVAAIKQIAAMPMAAVEGLEKLGQLLRPQVAAIESAPGHGVGT